MHRNHQIHVLLASNPDWYSELADCANPSNRRRGPRYSKRQDCAVRRYLLIPALERVLVRGWGPWRYDQIVREAVGKLRREDRELADACR